MMDNANAHTNPPGAGSPTAEPSRAAVSAEPSADLAAEADAPTEPFPCPRCGQMLGPDVRVCAVCRQIIDPGRIRDTAVALPEPLLATPHERPSVRFSWSIFAYVLLLWLLLAAAAESTLGPTKSQFVMVAVLLVSSGWVFSDARSRGIPRPLQWGVGSLLLWIVVFPWYLARRRQPEAGCAFVESSPRTFFRTMLLLVIIAIALSVIFAALRGPLLK